MARKAVLVGINDYHSISDLKGCINDVKNVRYLLRTYLGFNNEDIRVIVDSRATKAAIMERLTWLIYESRPGDFLFFHFSGHGSQIRDRNGDELDDHMDELICPYDMNWDGTFILDDDLGALFRQLPNNVLLEVILDCCHSGTGTRNSSSSEFPRLIRYLPPPPDIICRYEGEETSLKPPHTFKSPNSSTMNHILWASCESFQQASDAYINDGYNGAFTYYFCKHMRDTEGRISRRNLLERVRESLKFNRFFQTPQLECKDEAAKDNLVLQFTTRGKTDRMLMLTTPYMRGEDVKQVQEALVKAGYAISTDGVFGPNTRRAIIEFQRKNNLTIDGVAGSNVRSLLLP